MRKVNGQTAKEVSEMLLELTGTALLSNNFSLFRQCFHLPHVIETPDGKKVLRTREDMEAVFDRVVEDYRRKRITRLVRICEVAEFKSDTCITATHITHMMAGDTRVTDPFPVLSVLEFIDGRWQGTSSQYAVDKDTTVGRAMARDTSDKTQG